MSANGHRTRMCKAHGLIQWLARAGVITTTWLADLKISSSLVRAPVLIGMDSSKAASLLGGIKPERLPDVSTERSVSRTRLPQSSFRKNGDEKKWG